MSRRNPIWRVVAGVAVFRIGRRIIITPNGDF